MNFAKNMFTGNKEEQQPEEMKVGQAPEVNDDK